MVDPVVDPVVDAVAGTLGAGGVHRDPLWRVVVRLTPLEQDLLRTWWVRRLAFVAHAGAASLDTTQTYSRLEHSLGVLALVVRSGVDDPVVRAAALLHDVGHTPFSHSVEGVAGLDHHRLGVERVGQLGGLLRAHGVDAASVVDVVSGARPSALHGSTGALRLDHLDSVLRSGQAHGRTCELPCRTLERLRLVDGAVDTDAATATYLAELVAGEARSQSSAQNIVTTGVLRHLAGALLASDDAPALEVVAAMTDHELLSLLLTHPRTRRTAEVLRRDPTSWRAHRLGPSAAPHDGLAGDGLVFELRRLYLELPLVDGAPVAGSSGLLGDLPATPARYLIRPRHPEPAGP